MTQEDNFEKKVQWYISEIESGYYKTSYLPQILKPVYSPVKDNGLLTLTTREINLKKHDLMSKFHINSGIVGREGNYLAEKEILLLISKIEEIYHYQELDDLSPISLGQYLLPNNRSYFILVPRNILFKSKMKTEWLIEYNQEKNIRETKILSPPARVTALPKPIKNKMYIIDQPFGKIKYYSVDGSPNKRLEIQRAENGFTIRLLGLIWLQIDVHLIGDNSIFTLSDDLLELD